MAVETHEIQIDSAGNGQVIDLSAELERCLYAAKIRSGIVTVFVVGSTAAITTTEFEPGLATHDLPAFFEQLAPENGFYKHEETWHDDNGHSHVRASLLGPSVTIPLINGKLSLGRWQQVILIDFDTRPRQRRVVAQFVGD
jgi:secondary thiamine-phosphate synthase enzyme